VVLVGVDYISAEQFGAAARGRTRFCWAAGFPIVEGLDLRPVQAGDYELIVLPLKVRGHEGAPARAIMRRADMKRILLSVVALIYGSSATPAFKVVAFYTAKEDPAHISFVKRSAARGFRQWRRDTISPSIPHPIGTTSIPTFLAAFRSWCFWIRAPNQRPSAPRSSRTWSMAGPGWAFISPALR